MNASQKSFVARLLVPYRAIGGLFTSGTTAQPFYCLQSCAIALVLPRVRDWVHHTGWLPFSKNVQLKFTQGNVKVTDFVMSMEFDGYQRSQRHITRELYW